AYDANRGLPFASIYSRCVGVFLADGTVERYDAYLNPVSRWVSPPTAEPSGFAALELERNAKPSAYQQRETLAALMLRQNSTSPDQSTRLYTVLPAGQYKTQRFSAERPWATIASGQSYSAPPGSIVRIQVVAEVGPGDVIQRFRLNTLGLTKDLERGADGRYTLTHQHILDHDAELIKPFDVNLSVLLVNDQEIEVTIESATLEIITP
ncbi:MAG: hypothetical protein AAGA25_12990, partial [Planctomycetota bacterium]